MSTNTITMSSVGRWLGGIVVALVITWTLWASSTITTQGKQLAANEATITQLERTLVNVDRKVDNVNGRLDMLLRERGLQYQPIPPSK